MQAPGTHVLTFQDHFTKYKWAFIMNSLSSQGVCSWLKVLFEGWGVPKILMVYHRQAYKGDAVMRMCKTQDIVVKC